MASHTVLIGAQVWLGVPNLAHPRPAAEPPRIRLGRPAPPTVLGPTGRRTRPAATISQERPSVG